jgi:parallel beta helix pectate lyase-like protein
VAVGFAALVLLASCSGSGDDDAARRDASEQSTSSTSRDRGGDTTTSSSTSSTTSSVVGTTSASPTTRPRSSTATTSAPAPAPVPTAGPATPASTVPPLPPAPSPGEIVVSTVDEIRAALGSAQPGDVIRVADGEYTFKPRLVASASGSPGAPITLRGSRNAVLRTKNASGDYGLHIVGDYWRVEGLTVAHGSKGIVLDGSVGTVIDGVEVFDIGAEGVHFRSCSSDGVLRNSFVHDTGRTSAQYGEGVYVGSANSNWSDFRCTDAAEGQSQGDNTERVLIEDNVFEDITAEGADLKEGTDSGTLRRNVFRRAGISGQNSADSAVDAKGNNWVIEDNVVSETDATWDDDGVASPSEFKDGFQAHNVYDGYGTGNVFRRNQVVGSIPGFGVGLYPGGGNVVTCDNSAPGAAEGLVGDNGHPGTCT